MALVVARDLIERTPIESVRESYIKLYAQQIEDQYWYNVLVDEYNAVLQRHERDKAGVGTGLG
jgi:hypothetical protein